MRIDFYYFSYQCPLNDNMLRLLDEYKDKSEIYIHDFSENRQIAEQMKIYFPTLTVLDGNKRYYSPLNKSFMEQVSQGVYPIECPYLPEQSDKVAEYYIKPIKLSDIDDACACCGSRTESNCCKKKSFLEKSRQNIYGFIHTDSNGNLVGGAEYLPANSVPYNVPHNDDIAFITCVYMSDSEFDYKTVPLKALEKYLKEKYSKVIAVSDEKGVFPNGNLEFFMRNGYTDEGIIFEDPNYCRLHLVSKKL
ncbi:MAG: hypothetical protein IJ306_05525 [Oscillospiraceae bacterium]|nr:hypothetical protein [Oscillospiraceae bacterium]